MSRRATVTSFQVSRRSAGVRADRVRLELRPLADSDPQATGFARAGNLAIEMVTLRAAGELSSIRLSALQIITG